MTTYTQWHKEQSADIWHCWEAGKSPPGDLPVCGSATAISAAIFNASVTLEEMCPACRAYHQTGTPEAQP